MVLLLPLSLHAETFKPLLPSKYLCVRTGGASVNSLETLSIRNQKPRLLLVGKKSWDYNALSLQIQKLARGKTPAQKKQHNELLKVRAALLSCYDAKNLPRPDKKAENPPPLPTQPAAPTIAPTSLPSPVASPTPTPLEVPSGPPPLEVPSGLTVAQSSEGVVRITWRAVSNSEGFEIDRSPVFQSGAPMRVPRSITELEDRSGYGTFRYRARTFIGTRTSDWSDFVEVRLIEPAPNRPSQLRVSLSNLSTDVNVSWNDTSNDETGFRLERQSMNGAIWSATTSTQLNANVTTLLDHPGQGFHRYRIAALKESLTSGFTEWTTISRESGWTVFTPASSTRMIHVSSSLGDDTTGDGTEERPFKTFDRVRNEILNNHFDPLAGRWGTSMAWVLLKRGDIFRDRIFAWNFSGRSASEPFVVSAYGPESEARPVISPTSGDEAAVQIATSSLSNVALMHLDLLGRDEGSGQDGILMGGVGENLLIEDVRIRHFQNGIEVGASPSEVLSNVRIRRSVIADNFSVAGGHSQGLLANAIHGFLIEESVFDRNGWIPPGVVTPAHPGREPTIFNHNFYLYGQNEQVILRKNIVTRASANGISDNCSGAIEDNIVARNPVQIFARTAGTSVRNNVVLEGVDLSTSEPTYRNMGILIGPRWTDQPGAPRGPAVVEGNIVAHSLGLGHHPGIELTGSNYQEDASSITVRNNLVYNWIGAELFRVDGAPRNFWYDTVLVEGNVLHDDVADTAMIRYPFASIDSALLTFRNNRYWSANATTRGFYINDLPKTLEQWRTASGDNTSSVAPATFRDPTRTLATYHSTLGRSATFESFMDGAREQRYGSWDPNYAADPILSYLREGYAL